MASTFAFPDGAGGGLEESLKSLCSQGSDRFWFSSYPQYYPHRLTLLLTRQTTY